MIIKRSIILILLLCSGLLICSGIPEKPNPFRYVSDLANMFDDREVILLENRIRVFDQNTSNQIVIVTVPSLEGDSPYSYATEIGNVWGVGQEEFDNGIVILIKPKYRDERGEVFIAVGYGLEGVITDKRAKRIIENIMIPNFKKNQFYEGCDLALDKLMSMAKGEYSDPVRSDMSDGKIILLSFLGLMGLAIALIIIYFIYVCHRKVPSKYNVYYYEGKPNKENLLNYVEELERAFNKKYPKLKRFISKYIRNKRFLKKYLPKIEDRFFCIKMDGRNRHKVFWEFSDIFLKIIFIFMILIGIILFIISVMSMPVILAVIIGIVYFFFCRVFLSFLSAVALIILDVRQMKGKRVAGISITAFALEALLKQNVERIYSDYNGRWYYYPVVGGAFLGGFGHTSHGGFASSSGMGSFGGGGFGGGGAGGGW